MTFTDRNGRQLQHRDWVRTVDSSTDKIIVAQFDLNWYAIGMATRFGTKVADCEWMSEGDVMLWKLENA